MELESFEVLGERFVLSRETGSVAPESNSDFLLRNQSPFGAVEAQIPTSYTFCILLTNSCNLRCRYCFNPKARKRSLTYEIAMERLKELFEIFPFGEKYFVDLSGAGEPLLHLSEVIKIARWCKKMQNQLKKEVLPRLVTNGTLLTKEVVRILQKEGILFGVSLDGNKPTHDKNRVDIFGGGTYDNVMLNVNQIEYMNYVGCAVTIANDVFPLRETLLELLNKFKTISVRPARGPLSMCKDSEKLWEKEYEKLAVYIKDRFSFGDITLLKALLNGEDYFGTFVSNVLLSKKLISRCGQGFNQFAIGTDGAFYGCPAMAYSENATAIGLRSAVPEPPEECKMCSYRFLCGGECEVEYRRMGEINKISCDFRIRLIQLAAYIVFHLVNFHFLFLEALELCEEKEMRLKKDPHLWEFALRHPDLSFTEAKKLYDSMNMKY